MAAPQPFDKEDMKRRMKGAVATVKQEFGGLRTGRASPALLDPIMVEAYGSPMPLNQVGTVNAPEPRLLTVQVWDKSLVKAVDKAMVISDVCLMHKRGGRSGDYRRASSRATSTRSPKARVTRTRTTKPR